MYLRSSILYFHHIKSFKDDFLKGELMSELIKIELEVIGAEEVNSVNARDLHATLEIKKKFADWIKNQINTLGLEENVDFITVPLKGNGGKFGGTDYIITTDTAKHISMASRTPKGKEVRSYFIKVEKEAKQGIVGNDTNAVMLEMLKMQEQMIENSQKQTEAVIELVKSMKQTPKIEVKPHVQYLDSRDRKKLRDAIQTKAKEVARDLGVSVSTISPSIWIELKHFFDVDDYQDIHKSQMKDVMHFVMFWEPRKEQFKKELPENVVVV